MNLPYEFDLLLDIKTEEQLQDYIDGNCWGRSLEQRLEAVKLAREHKIKVKIPEDLIKRIEELKELINDFLLNLELYGV